MRISVSEAEGQLDELVRRAAAGDEVVLTREGGRDVRLVPEASQAAKKERLAPDELRRLVTEIQKSAARNMTPCPDAARSQDFLYDEFGLPK